jgi:hypothetical protein
MEAEAAAAEMGMMSGLFALAFIVLIIASMWRIFTKAGQPGWMAIIPILNLFIMLKIVGKPWWWIIGFLIPFVNFIVAILLSVALAKVFGKGIGFAIGLLLLGFIFYPILAFSDAQYTPPAEAA